MRNEFEMAGMTGKMTLKRTLGQVQVVAGSHQRNLVFHRDRELSLGVYRTCCLRSALRYVTKTIKVVRSITLMEGLIHTDAGRLMYCLQTIMFGMSFSYNLSERGSFLCMFA